MPRARVNPKGKGKTVRKSVPKSFDDFISAAQTAIENMEVEQAVHYYGRALSMQPDSYDTMDALADLQLQLGNVDSAFELLKTSTSQAPDRNGIKWMYLAQLCKGEESVKAYQKGIQILSHQVSGLVREGPHTDKQVRDLNKEIISAYCGLSELYMTDLCFEPNAEESCETAVMNALVLDNANTEALQTLASLRISQCRKEEACGILEALYQKLEVKVARYHSRNIADELLCTEEDMEAINDLPTPEQCVSFVKLLLECAVERKSFAEHAEKLLQYVLQFDDENPEVWYLLGVSNKSMAVVDVGAAVEAFAQCKSLLTPMIAQLQKRVTEIPVDGVMPENSIQALLCAVEEAERELILAHGEEAVANAINNTTMDEDVGDSSGVVFSARAFLQNSGGSNDAGAPEEEEAWSTDDEEDAMDDGL